MENLPNSSSDKTNASEQTLPGHVTSKTINASVSEAQTLRGTLPISPSRRNLVTAESEQMLPASFCNETQFTHERHQREMNVSPNQSWTNCFDPILNQHRQKIFASTVDGEVDAGTSIQPQSASNKELNQPNLNMSTGQHVLQYDEEPHFTTLTPVRRNDQSLPPPQLQTYQLCPPAQSHHRFSNLQICSQKYHLQSLDTDQTKQIFTARSLPPEIPTSSTLQSHASQDDKNQQQLSNYICSGSSTNTNKSTSTTTSLEDEHVSLNLKPEITEKHVNEDQNEEFLQYALVEVEKLKKLKIVSLDFVGIIPCVICGDTSSGYHYGALTCRPCKHFIHNHLSGRRNIKECISHTPCTINKRTRNDCQDCRWKKCLQHMKERRKGKRDSYADLQLVNGAYQILISYAKGTEYQRNLFDIMIKAIYLKIEKRKK